MLPHNHCTIGREVKCIPHALMIALDTGILLPLRGPHTSCGLHEYMLRLGIWHVSGTVSMHAFSPMMHSDLMCFM